MAAANGVAVVHRSYEEVIADPDVDAVYIPLVNSLHLPWTMRALRAGKHVLCEKPLGCSAAEARTMAGAARESGLLVMEALMYRFHPRMVDLRARTTTVVRLLHAAFSFTVNDEANYRLSAELGGGALLDVGCYTLDVARWFCGTPRRVTSIIRGSPVDMSVAALIEFGGGALAAVTSSLEAAEQQELTIVTDMGAERIDEPFTAWHDPHDPYQLMVEAFADSALEGAPSPLPLEESIATAELTDRVRGAAAGPHELSEGAVPSAR